MTLEEIFVRMADERLPQGDFWNSLKWYYSHAGDNLRQALEKEGLKIEYNDNQFRVELIDNHDQETIYVSADINFLFELRKKDYYDKSFFGEDTGIELI